MAIESATGLAGVLIERGAVSPEQLAYARRVRAKLPDAKPLLHVLYDLGVLDEARLKQVLGSAPVEVPVGELLIDLGLLDEDALQRALELQREDPDTKRRLGDVLIEHRFVAPAALYEALSYQLGRPPLDPLTAEIDRELLRAAPQAWCQQHRFLPIRREGERVLVAFADLDDRESFDAAVRVFGGGRVEAVLSPGSAIDEVWARHVPVRSERGSEPSESAAVEAVDAMLRAAIERDASDIHVEPMEGRLRIRFREDGVLVPYRDLPASAAPAFTSRLKVMCRADIAERRRHQGGRFAYQSAGLELDLRASFYVTVHGEKTVLRLLNRARTLLSLEEIGMPRRTLERFKEDALERPSGVILVTGPTGSGKTSTLYSSIQHINHDGVAILSAEDPVEYVIEGISQCSLNPEIDLTYEETLRHIVRQDPDVIVIGEIRDTFSAETAIQAALTGHQVITTFHTEDTIGGLVRLLNMNIEAFLISSTVVSVLAQRLVRRVCRECASPYQPTAGDLRRIGYRIGELEGAHFLVGRGCRTCRETGYRGRTAVFELLVLGEAVRDAILERRTSQEIRRVSRSESGLVSLFEDGLVKAARGETTIAELLRTLPRLDAPRPLPELRRLVGE